MADLQKQVLEKTLHSHAQEAAEEYITQFADALIFQSKTLATLQGADEVQSFHVASARDIILRSTQSKSRSRELLILVGSVLLGAFLQGFITEFSNNRPGWMIVYVVAGLVGMLLTFWGFRK